jgi:hypothetical protein
MDDERKPGDGSPKEEVEATRPSHHRLVVVPVWGNMLGFVTTEPAGAKARLTFPTEDRPDEAAVLDWEEAAGSALLHYASPVETDSTVWRETRFYVFRRNRDDDPRTLLPGGFSDELTWMTPAEFGPISEAGGFEAVTSIALLIGLSVPPID